MIPALLKILSTTFEVEVSRRLFLNSAFFTEFKRKFL